MPEPGEQDAGEDAELVSGARAATPIYVAAERDGELRQSEIITNLAQYNYTHPGQVEEVRHRFLIVLAQDCDLLRDFEQTAGNSILNGMILYELRPYAEAKQDGPPGREMWKRIAQNNDERYHFLEPVPAACDLQGDGLPALLIDFRRCFTLPPREIYRQCSLEGSAAARRRCRLEMPYREHLQGRVAFYFQRVGLPTPHNTDGL